jgi:hypothetical protein
MTYLASSSCIVGSALNYYKGLNPAADWRREKMTVKTKTKHDLLDLQQLRSWYRTQLLLGFESSCRLAPGENDRKKQKQSMSYLGSNSCIVSSTLNYCKVLNPAANWHWEKMTIKNKNKVCPTWPTAVA